ncbi:MAG: VirB3 family type IV secretion system protein [Pseudomonadota bacterium]|nr:VirB3 family type IV secretion system protein [Pseudomonadota bacterium]
MSARRRQPVARVLTEPCLILGVEKPFAITNFTLAMVLAGELHLFGFLLVSCAVHLALRHATRRDPFTRRVYARYNLQGDSYEPWIRAGLRQGRRSDRALRELPC